MPLTMTVEILPAEFPKQDVTIPDCCPNPKCNADFHAPGNLRELGYTATGQCFTMPKSGNATDIVDWDLREECDDVQFITGYDCFQCGALVAGSRG